MANHGKISIYGLMTHDVTDTSASSSASRSPLTGNQIIVLRAVWIRD